MFTRKNRYATERQLNHMVDLIESKIAEKAAYQADLLKFYRQTVQRHSEELNMLAKIVIEAGLIVELDKEKDNSVVEYLDTKWKIKKVK